MKQLLIIRHAKTEQQNYDNDFDRTLTSRGISDCKLMSKKLICQNILPQFVLSSSATRTRQTTLYLSKELGWQSTNNLFISQLYLAPYSTILKYLKQMDNNFNSLALVCHNPGITDLFNFISISKLDNMPTCGMALFSFDTDKWEDIANGKLEWISWPKKED